MTANMLAVLAALAFVRLLSSVECACPTTVRGGTKPLYLLKLVPFPQDNAGWDRGLGIISGSRVAQEEINNRTDLLPGYHIELIVENIEACSRTEAGIGLSNLVRYTDVSSPCRPVVAVSGLVCSSHTASLSPIAGRDGFDLIQLSIANSPIFTTRSSSFPHLWRLLGSDTAYATTALALMDQFGWTRIGLVYDIGSVFHSETARYFAQQVNKLGSNKTIAFEVAVSGTNRIYFEQVLYHLRNSEETIMFVSLNADQNSLLLNHTLNEGFVYPDYTWILVETTIEKLESSNVLESARIRNASRGHIHLFAQTHPENKSLTLPSGGTLASLKEKLDSEFNEVIKEYSMYNVTRYEAFESPLYDEVWALGLALHRSLPILASRNLSIDNYSIGQHEITRVIEDQLGNLSFQGAGGWVEFNEHRTVSTPIEVLWVLKNGTEQLVGIHNPLSSSGFHVNIDSSELPSDIRSRVYVLIPLPAAIVLYVLIAVLIMVTSIQLILYLYYRDHKVIKATSPYLSLLMFGGCYLLCVAATLKTTASTFIIPRKDFLVLLSADFIVILNGFSLILITLLIKLLRVYRIFTSKLKRDLGSYWTNLPLLLTIIFLTILPNLIIVPLILRFPIEYHVSYTYRGTHTEVHIDTRSRNYFVNVGLIASYIAVFCFIILYLVLRTCNIRHENFNDTKKLNIFNSILFFTTTLVPSLYVILLLRDQQPAANAILVLGMLIIVTASQFILFLPKVLPTVLSSVYPQWKTVYTSIVSYINPTE